MKRKTRFFLERAKHSLVLAVEIFNRPIDTGRVEGVLLFLDHAFEMLLKAVVFEKTGRIRKARERLNYNFQRCVNICVDQLSLIDTDEAVILHDLNSFRDAAAHDIVVISEGLLYAHAQSAVQIFASLLKKVFNQGLVGVLPDRILPVSTSIPGEINTVIAADMEHIRNLLSPRRRREDEAEAKLRSYRIIEENIRRIRGIRGRMPSLQGIIKHLKQGDWKPVLPMVAGIVQPDTGGIPISLHVSKAGGFPVRIDPRAPTAIAFRYVRPEDKWPYLTRELADKLDISITKVVGLAKIFAVKGNEDFHTSIKVSRTSSVQRYSQKTFDLFREAIRRHGVDWLWNVYKEGHQLRANDYIDSMRMIGGQTDRG